MATIWRAAKDGNMAALTHMLLAAPSCEAVDARDAQGYTALMHACEKGRVCAAELLLRHGADPNAREKFGDTCLLFAASWAHLDIVKLLLAHGADPNIADVEYDTPLIIAAAEGHVGVCEALLRAGAHIGHSNEAGWSPAHAAIANDRDASLRVLLRAGVDPTGDLSRIPFPWALSQTRRLHASRRLTTDMIASFTLRLHSDSAAGVGAAEASASPGGSCSTGKERPAVAAGGGALTSLAGELVQLAVEHKADGCLQLLMAHNMWLRRAPLVLLRELLVEGRAEPASLWFPDASCDDDAGSFSLAAGLAPEAPGVACAAAASASACLSRLASRSRLLLGHTRPCIVLDWTPSIAFLQATRLPKELFTRVIAFL